MNQTLAYYHQRSPRYILLPQENCLVRIAGPKQLPWEEGTEIKNISATGLSFTAPDILAPQNGELVKIQFEVPGAQMMACHARVVRVATVGKDQLLVGIEFEALTDSQRRNLFRGLKGKKFIDEGTPLELDSASKIPKGMYFLFILSVVLSLYLSAYLLFSLFHFLSDPHWIDKISYAIKFLLG